MAQEFIKQGDRLVPLGTSSVILTETGSSLIKAGTLTNVGDSIEVAFPNLTFALVKNATGMFPQCASLCVKHSAPRTGQPVIVLYGQVEMFTNTVAARTARMTIADTWNTAPMPMTVGVIEDAVGYSSGSSHYVQVWNLMDNEVYRVEAQATSIEGVRQNIAEIGWLAVTRITDA